MSFPFVEFKVSKVEEEGLKTTPCTYIQVTDGHSISYDNFSFSEPLLVVIEYVPFGDLLGYLRKSRGLNDTYYKDPDIKPKTSLTSHQLMKFAWQIGDGMSYLSSKRVRNAFVAILSFRSRSIFLLWPQLFKGWITLSTG